jgi:hypothetical protein
MELPPFHGHQQIGGGPTDLRPPQRAERCLELCAIKLSIAQHRHLCTRRHERGELFEQITMGCLREVAFLALDHNPGERQGTSVIDHTEHQRDTAAANDTTIHHEREWLLRQRCQQGLGHGQKPAVQRVVVVLEPALETLAETFLVGAMTGRMIGDGRQMCAGRPLDHRSRPPRYSHVAPDGQ